MSDAIEASIGRALSECRRGNGATVLLAGPPGRGTTHRLAAAAARAAELGLRVATARGRRAERSLGFSVAVDLFAPLWRAERTPSLAAELADGPARDAVALLDHAGGAEPPHDGGYSITRGLWTLARRLADLPAASGSLQATRRANPAGLAIVVDDLHDVDGPSLGLLAYVAERISDAPVAILAGGRSDLESCSEAAIAAVSAAARCHVPEPLSAHGGAALVTSLLPDASARFTEVCVEACAGDVALLHTLLVALAGAGVRGSDADVGRVRTPLPEAVIRLATQRLARLSGPARDLARAVAVCGRTVGFERLAAASGVPAGLAFEALDALVRADIIRAGERLSFAQPIMAEAVRASLTPGQRTRLAALGGDPEGASRARLEALTPSESRVAGLAARGMTTRQIGETLFVTPKTVEFHLRNVYAKLAIPSTRVALAQALDVPEPVRSPE